MISLPRDETPLEKRIKETVRLLREYADYLEEMGLDPTWHLRHLADTWEVDGCGSDTFTPG